MLATPTKSQRLALLGLLATALALTAFALQGQDANYDLRNYHLYNAHAWLEGRYAIDIAAAQQQSWHNPLIDFPLVLLPQLGLGGLGVSLWLCVPVVLALMFALDLAGRYMPGGSRAERVAAYGFLALGMIGGAAALSQVATSFNDWFVAAGMMIALWLLARDPDTPATPRAWLLAGLIGGATVGLKLTAAPFCIGLAAAALAIGDAGTRMRHLLLLAVGGLCGALLTQGWWSWHLWTEHANPVFPYLNQWFGSPDALATPHTDLRFRPHSLLDALLSPIQLLRPGQQRSELLMSDPRMLLAWLASLGLLLLSLPAAVRGDLARIRPGERVLCAFFVVSFAIWLWAYGIYRYLLVLELLCFVLVAAVMARVPAYRLRVALLFGLLALCVGLTTYPRWGRVPVDSAMAVAEPLPVGPDALVVTASGWPLGYAATLFPANVALIGLSNNFMHPGLCTGLQREAEQRVQSHPGSLWLLRGDHEIDLEGRDRLAPSYGLVEQPGCRQWRTNIEPLWLCPLRRDVERRKTAACP